MAEPALTAGFVTEARDGLAKAPTVGRPPREHGWVPDGVEVRPEDLRRVARLLRDDTARVDAARGQAVSAAEATVGAAGDGPLAGAADPLAARLDALLRGVTSRVLESADALDAASTQYLDVDRAAAGELGAGGAPPVVLPRLEPPR